MSKLLELYFVEGLLFGVVFSFTLEKIGCFFGSFRLLLFLKTSFFVIVCSLITIHRFVVCL